MQLKCESPRPPEDLPIAGPLDLSWHDLPHGKSATEWWYLNSHFTTTDGRAYSLFAAFFRVIAHVHPDGRVEYSHSLTWALTDPARQMYRSSGYVEKNAPAMALERLRKGHGIKDARLNRAAREVLERGQVPKPDRLLQRPVRVSAETLDLDFDVARLSKDSAGRYRLSITSEDAGPEALAAELSFTPMKGPIRHGADGVVRGTHGEDMYYYFIPRCAVEGRLSLGGVDQSVTGDGWFDHEFARPPTEQERAGGEAAARITSGAEMTAWNWLAIQLDDGTEVSVYELTRRDRGDASDSVERCAVTIDAAGSRQAYPVLTLTANAAWQSMRTFEEYPTHHTLHIPGAELSLDITATFPDQEFVTVMSKPAFWEGRCEVTGTRAGQPVKGLGYLERSGHTDSETLDDFFKNVGRAVRASVRAVAPLELTPEYAARLAAAPGREDYLDGVDLPQLSRTLIAPVRAITDRGGKAWRSYAALACCEIVGGDSRPFSQWLAFPELMHTGSLIVDDVQDKSVVRRGGPAAHLLYGDAIALNAGTAAYFMGERLLTRSLLSDADKLRVYDLYFEALRAGHAGQAIDLDGLAAFVPAALESGDFASLERRVLAIHRLKTAVPAAALARMGGVAGGGTREQVDGLGNYFDALGLAFQIIDDVLNLRGFEGDLKQRGEDLAQGKLTLPVAKALGRLDPAQRRALWSTVAAHPTEPAVIADAVEQIERCGALDACTNQARDLLEAAWQRLDPLVDASQSKIMLRAFGSYVLERHY